MDIRNFFNAKSKEQPRSKNVPIKNRPKPLISDSSDEEMEGEAQHNTESVLKVKLINRKPKNDGAVEKKAHKRQLSDSSDDELEPAKQSNPSKQTKLVKGEIDNKSMLTKNGTKSKTYQSSEVNTLKPVDAKDFFKKVHENSNTKKNYNTPGTQNGQAVEKNGKHVNISPQKTSLSTKTNGRFQPESKPIQVTPTSSQDGSISSQVSNQGNPQMRNSSEKVTQLCVEKYKPTGTPGKQNSQAVEKNGKNVNISPQKTSLSTKTNGRFQPESKPIQVTPNSSQDGSISSQISNQGNPQMRNSSEKVSQLWVEKYKPTGTKNIIGQQGDRSNLKKLQNWLKGWDKHHGIAAVGKPPTRPPPWGASKDDGAWAKAALLSGPPGVGKTTTSYLVAKEMGYEIMETNASDTRSKKALDTEISDAMSSKSVTGSSSRR